MLRVIDHGHLRKTNRDVIYLSIHFIALLATQTAYAYAYVHSEYLRHAIVLPILFRLSAWTLPVFIYLIMIKVNPFSYLKMTKNIFRGVLWGTLIGIMIVFANLIGSYLMTGTWKINFNLALNSGSGRLSW